MAQSLEIASTMKQNFPPTLYGSMSVDIMNMKAYFKIFNTVKNSKDDKMLEKVTHLILVNGALHNNAVEQAMLPLVKSLSDGGTLAQEMSGMLKEKEEMAAKIQATKKHINNKEFIDLMGEFEQKCNKGCDMMLDTLDRLASEVEEDALIDAAVKVETTKMTAPVMPRLMQYA